MTQGNDDLRNNSGLMTRKEIDSLKERNKLLEARIFEKEKLIAMSNVDAVKKAEEDAAKAIEYAEYCERKYRTERDAAACKAGSMIKKFKYKLKDTRRKLCILLGISVLLALLLALKWFSII